MDHLEEISIGDLQRALDDVDGKKQAQRLITAIAYKNGVTQTELAEWYGVERRTIYSWLQRLDPDALAESVTDAQRPGRPRKLSAEERAEFERTVREPPAEVGYDEPAWSPKLVQEYLAERFDVEYSIPSCRRLLKEAGLDYQKPINAPESGSSEADGTTTEERGWWVPQ